jgi:signal transduction histidine kinase
MQDIEIIGLDGELIQSFMNILSNAQDALVEQNAKSNFIFINLFKEEEFAIIQIKDTAGGIAKGTIEHIFEPYFTTKHQSHGTGIGLYMTYEIIVKHHGGTIKVENSNFNYDGQEYTGANFTIKLPLI